MSSIQSPTATSNNIKISSNNSSSIMSTSRDASLSWCVARALHVHCMWIACALHGKYQLLFSHFFSQFGLSRSLLLAMKRESLVRSLNGSEWIWIDLNLNGIWQWNMEKSCKIHGVLESWPLLLFLWEIVRKPSFPSGLVKPCHTEAVWLAEFAVRLAILDDSRPSCTSRRHILEHPSPLCFGSRSGSATAGRCGRSTCLTRYPARLCKLCLGNDTGHQLEQLEGFQHRDMACWWTKKIPTQKYGDILRHLKIS